MPDDPNLRVFECVLAYSVANPDDSRLPRMFQNSQKTHIIVTCGGWGVNTPSPPHLLLSPLMTNPAPKAFIPPLSSIQKLDSCKDSPRDWEEVRFGSWGVSTSRANTCSSQEALEATFDLSIRVPYSWSFAPRRLEVSVSSHSFVVELPKVCIIPFLRENNSKWLNPPMWLIGRGKRVIGQTCSLWAPQWRCSSFVEWTSG